MSGPFDRSLETRELLAAAEEHALRRGEPGTAAYRAAWLEFRQRVRTIEDLRPSGQPRTPANTKAAKVLNAAIERAIVIDGASMVTTQVVDPQDQTLRIAVHSGFSREFLNFFETVDGSESACGSALHAAAAVWVPDITESPIFAGTPALDVMLNAGSRAVASVPITSSSGRLIAMISTHHAQPAQWNHQRRLDLQRIAQATGRMLEHVAPTVVGNRSTGPTTPPWSAQN